MDGAISLLAVDRVEKAVDVERVEAMERRERNDELPEDAKDGAKEEAVELRPAKCEPMSDGSGCKRTRIDGLSEHPLDDLRRVPAQQGLDVSHRLVGDVDGVVHGDEWVRARRGGSGAVARQVGTFLAGGAAGSDGAPGG